MGISGILLLHLSTCWEELPIPNRSTLLWIFPRENSADRTCSFGVTIGRLMLRALMELRDAISPCTSGRTKPKSYPQNNKPVPKRRIYVLFVSTPQHMLLGTGYISILLLHKKSSLKRGNTHHDFNLFPGYLGRVIVIFG